MRRLSPRVGLAATLVAISAHAGAAEDPAARAVPAIRVFDDKAGLPQNSASALAFDRDGRLWVGTQEGIAVYDGNAFRRVPLPEGSHSEWVTSLALLPGPSGAMAAATHADGVWLIDDARARFDHETTANGLPDDTVLAIATDAAGELWAGTRKGVARRPGGGGKWAALADAPATGRVLAIAARRGGGVWAGTESEIARFDGAAWASWKLGDAGLPRAAVRGLYVPPEGPVEAWASFRDGGIARFDGARWTASSGMPCEDADPMLETRGHPGEAPTLWVGTDCGGLVRVDGDRRIVLDKKTSALPSDFVISLLASRPDQGRPSLWVGTDGGGIARVSLAGFGAIGAKSSAIDTPVYAFGWSRDEGGDASWIGTQAGLLRWDGRGWAPVKLPTLIAGDQYTNAILEAHGDGERGLWVGTFGGVARLHDGAWSLYAEKEGLPARIVLSLFEATSPLDGRPELLAGMRNGLARFTGDRWAPITEPGSPAASEVTSMTESTSPDGPVLWIATTDAGLFRRDKKGWTNLSTKSSPLLGDEVLQVQRARTSDGRDRIFVSTGEAGVAWFDPALPTAAWGHLSTKTDPPLPDNLAYGVVQDRAGRVYACTNHGVARLVPRGPDAYDVDVYRTEDGLPSEECNTGAMAIDPRGRVWAGTVAGAAVLDPQETADDRIPKKLLLTDTRLFADPIDLAKKPELTHEESTLSFAFSLVSYHREADTRFRTQLVGLDREPSAWTPDAKVRYTSLPAGHYEMRVWGRDYAGNVSGPIVVPFHVRPPPWLTWWAFLGYAVAGVSLVVTSMRVREAALKREARELEEKIAARTKELAASIKELDRKNQALLESHERANRIFSAFADVLPGSVLDGKYRVEEKIGEGGFGAVFRAEQSSLSRKVAVKVFRPTPGNDSAAALDRFQREGASACRVNHPNAIQVYDSGISGDGIAYLVMELLDGHPLRAELRRSALPLGRALWIAGSVCDALAAAHGVGIVHRDVKPDNVFLQRAKDGEVPKLLDFGIAKLLDADEPTDDPTASAALLGTPRYMAPERLAHEERSDDARGDVYSLGVSLYEAIAGGSPWPRTDDVFVLIGKIVTGTIPPLTDLGVPARVSELVASAMSRDPGARPTAAELARDLSALRESLAAAELDRIYGRTSPEPGALGEGLSSHISPMAETTGETKSMHLRNRAS